MREEKIKVAAYARVSTLLGQDPELQLIRIREYAKANGYTLVEEYVDLGVSGTRERRAALDRMIADAEKGRFQIIACTALDRVGRNVRHLLNLLHSLNENGVQIVSLRENIGQGPFADALRIFVSAVAALERDLISERIRTALAAKKLAAQQLGTNWRCGRPPVIAWDLIQEVIALRQGGKSIRGITRALAGRASKSTVERILRKERQNVPSSET